MLRALSCSCDERKVDVGRCGRRKFLLSLLSCLFQSLKSHSVVGQVNAFLALEILQHVVCDRVVKVIAAEVAVAVNCENFDDAVADIDDRNIECAAAKVIDHDLLIYFVVKAVSQSCCCRLVDDTLYFKTCDLAGVLCCLALSVVEVCRNCDDCLCDLLTDIVLSVSLQFLKDHSGDLLRCVGLAAHGNLLICSDLSLDGSDRVVSICNCLTFCRLTDKSLT